MTRMTPLLERNEQFAHSYTPVPLGPPTVQVLIVTCLDHRVDPRSFSDYASATLPSSATQAGA